jgi:hypothetical protein
MFIIHLLLRLICSYHHVLLDIRLDTNQTFVSNSQKKPLSAIQPVIDALNK